MNVVPIILIVAAVVAVLLILGRLGIIRLAWAVAVSLVIVVVAFIAGTKFGQIHKMMTTPWNMPPTHVTTATATEEEWAPVLPSVGSLTAVEGVTVAAQLDGNIVKIAFQAGSAVKAGDLLVQQDVTSEEAQLRAAEAQVELARINRDRSRELFAKATIAQSQLDSDEAAYKQAVADADNIRTTIAKKTIVAPFSGRLGIRLVDLGQTLKAGDPIVSLQALDPIYADFYLPQQDLSRIAPGTVVDISSDAIPGRDVKGSITAINPDVDSATRNVKVEATIANADEALHPGMYVDVQVVLPSENKVLVIPQTSVLYAPFGDSVYVVDEKDGGKVARQVFVRLGEKRGDFVAVESGIKAGDTVVSTGAFTLRNGAPVLIDNSIAPVAELAPKPSDS